MAKDSYNREIDYLRISVTDQCNLGCLYCVPGGRPPGFRPGELLKADEILRIVRAALRFGVRKVRLTGGEPLLRGDIIQIIDMIKAAGVRDLSITTNGALLAGMADALKEAGLDRVNVSLDTMEPDKYRKITGGGELQPILNGINEARRAGLSPVKINMVPIRGINEDEIADFARLTLDEPSHVRFIEFMPSGRKDLWDRKRVISSAETMERVSEVGPLVRLEFKGRGPSRNYRIEGAVGMLGFISPVSHTFCYCCNRLRVNAVGRIRPCLFSRTEIDVASPMRRGADDGEVERLFALAVKVKPEGNYLAGLGELNGPGRSTDVVIGSMSSIGG